MRRKMVYLIAFLAVFVCIITNLLIDVVIKKVGIVYVKRNE
jgi:hypothetical protein